MKNKRLLIIFGVATGLLLLPLLAMQFTEQVAWSFTDFIIAALLLFGLGTLIELSLRKLETSKYKAVVIALIIVAFFLIWAELAVGLFGTPLAGS